MKLTHFKNTWLNELSNVHNLHSDIVLKIADNDDFKICTSKFLLSSVSSVFKKAFREYEEEEIILIDTDGETISKFIELICVGEILSDRYDDILKVKSFARSVGFIYALRDPEDAYAIEDFKVKLEPETELIENDEENGLRYLKVEPEEEPVNVFKSDDEDYGYGHYDPNGNSDGDQENEIGQEAEEFGNIDSEQKPKKVKKIKIKTGIKRPRKIKKEKTEEDEKTNGEGSSRWKKWTCEKCNLSFWREFKYLLHLSTHIGDKALECTGCQKVLRTQREWDYHRHFMHKPKETVICDLCGKTITKHNIYAHMKHKHSDVRPFACHLCDYRAKFKVRLEKHLVTHDKEPRYICDLCGKKYRDQGSLQLHMVRHGKKPGYPCDICKKVYKTPYDLKIHLAIHEGKLQVTCDLCGKVYTSQIHLKRHKMICNKTFDVKCRACSFETFKKNFRKHVIVNHSGINAYRCPFCKELFKHQSSLLRHKKSAHPGQKQTTPDIIIDPEVVAKLVKELMVKI